MALTRVSEAPGESPGRKLGVASAVLLAVGLVATAVSYGNGVARGYQLFLILLQVLVAAIGLGVLRVRSGRLDPLNPAVLVIGMFPLLYSWPAYLVLKSQDPFSTKFSPTLGNDLALQQSSILLATAGLVLFIVAYVLCQGGDSGLQAGARSSTAASPGIGFRGNVVMALGLLLTVALVVSVGGLGNLLANLYNRTQFFEGRNYLALGPVVCFSGALGRAVAQGTFPLPTRTKALLTAAIALTLLTGSKANLAIEFLSLLSVLHYRQRRLAAPVVALALLSLVMSLTAYNLYFRDALPRGLPLSQVVSERGGPVAAIGEGFVGNTLFGHQALSLAITYFPGDQRLGMSAYTPLLVAPVPRALLPGKAEAPSGAFTRRFAPDFYAAGSTVPSTALGEMYMAFGALGLLFGCGLFGAVIGRVCRRSRQDARSLITLAVTSATVLHYLRGESYGVAVIYLLLLLPALWVAGPGQPLAADPSGEAEATHLDPIKNRGTH